MNKKIVTGLLAATTFFVAGSILPLAVSAQSAPSSTWAVPTVSTTAVSPVPSGIAVAYRVCSVLNRNLSTGMQGDDVRSLQEFLRDRGHLSASATGYFGSLTAAGVAQWQTSQGVTPLGIFGPQSRERLLGWCAGGITQPTSEAFTATPLSGDAPLRVTFQYKASCDGERMGGLTFDGRQHRVDFGDGSTTSADCGGVVEHTYATNGRYTATYVDPGGCGPNADPRCLGTPARIIGSVIISVGPRACTMEYNPVCGLKPIVCITTPCDPIPTTYGNRCAMEADGATFSYAGECRPNTPPTPIPDTVKHRVCRLLFRNLSTGMQGDDVRALQEFLRERGALNANATGYFGALTTAAVTQWQSSQGVTPLGIFGPASRERLLRWCKGETVDPQPKILNANPTSGAAPLAVTFRAHVAIMNPQVVADVGSYKITFGDGSEHVLSCVATSTPGCAAPQFVQHTYTANGTYTASLVHYGYFPPPGGPGSRVVDSVTITVGAPSTTGGNQPPVISSFSGPTTLAVNTSGTWTIQASDPEQGVLKYLVQWGDEWYARSGYYTDSIYPGAPIVQTSTFTHSYATPGNYTVRVLVRDEAGKEAKTSATVQVGSTTSTCPDVSAPVCGRPTGCANTCPAGMYCAMVCQLQTPVTYPSACHRDAAGATPLHTGTCTATSSSMY